MLIRTVLYISEVFLVICVVFGVFELVGGRVERVLGGRDDTVFSERGRSLVCFF